MPLISPLQVWVDRDLPILFYHDPCRSQLRQTVAEVAGIDAIANRKGNLLAGELPAWMLQQQVEDPTRATVAELLEPEISSTARYQGRGVSSRRV